MKQKDVYILLISAFVIIVFWIGFTVYHNSINSTISEALNIQIIPINPTFDTKTIDIIKKRDTTAPLYESVTKTDEELSPTPTVATSGGQILP